ncbi:uncharacterized protein [Watersipora subatra]|uniref:uncharacterized protein n=1 Tax=Watersipora subatra TaxID=2589382 RepID=UPI00355BE155
MLFQLLVFTAVTIQVESTQASAKIGLFGDVVVRETNGRQMIRDSPHISIDKVTNKSVFTRPASVNEALLLPNPKQGYGSKVTPTNGEETVDIRLERKPNDIILLKFESHGRQHLLELTESRTQLRDIDIRLVGASDEFRQQVTDKLQDIRMMRDRKSGARVAMNREDSKEQLKAGVFRIGKHEFTLATDQSGSGKAKVTRQSVRQIENYKRDRAIPKERTRQKRSLPQTIEPISATVELVMVIDFAVWNKTSYGSISAANETDHMVNLLLYYAHMAEIVNDYFGTMKNDDIRIAINLTGIVVLAVNTTLNDLVQDHVVNNTYIDAESTLDSFTTYLNSSEAAEVLPPADHVMLFTGYDMFDKEDGFTGVVGLAWTGTICEPGYSSSLIETGFLLTYDASTAAHELGHSLGSYHDGEDSSIGCADDNYIMAAQAGKPTDLSNRFLFSCCSQRSFYVTIHEYGSCLSNTSAIPNYNTSIDDNVEMYFAGQVFSADDQCYIHTGTWACNESIYSIQNTSICLDLWCVYPDDLDLCTNSYTAAADGTECGDGMWCSLGECVDQGSLTSTLDQNCQVNRCYGTEKSCLNGSNTFRKDMLQCYNGKFQCDCYNDCTDGSDEEGCSDSCTCPLDYTKCVKG